MKIRSYITAGLATVLLLNTVSAHAAGDEKSAKAEAAGKESFGRRLSLDYANADVADVLRALASQSGINVAINPTVKGQVTVHLRDKTVDEAVLMVANLAGLGAKRVNDTYVVAPRAEMRPTLERLGTFRHVPIRYLEPQAAADLIQGAFPDVTAHAQAKGVVLAGAGEDLDAAERLLQKTDVIAPGEIHTIESVAVKHMTATKAKDALSKIEPELKVQEAGAAVVLSGTKAQVETGKQSLELIDVQAPPDADIRMYSIRFVPAAQLAMLVERAVPGLTVLPGPESYAPPRPSFNPLTSQFAGSGGSSSGSSGSNGSSPSGGPSGSSSSPAGGAGGGMGGSSGGPSSGSNSGVGGSGTGSAGAPGSSGMVGGMVVGNALCLLLKGTPAQLDQGMQVLTLADVAPRQMMIEAKVIESSPSLTSDIGMQWNWSPLSFFETQPGAQITGTGSLENLATKKNSIGVFSRLPFSFQGTLNAMITKGTAKLLANPQIAVINDQDASIFIGDTLRFESLATSSPTTGNQFTVVETPVGIILLVHPRINDDGNITMHVHPVVSTVTSISSDGLPQTSSREAETTVRVKDGDTLVIGGLIRDEDVVTMSKIPLLGDLPFLGQLFRNTNRQHHRTEVTVVLTIHLLK